jgi:hypothetical protein
MLEICFALLGLFSCSFSVFSRVLVMFYLIVVLDSGIMSTDGDLLFKRRYSIQNLDHVLMTNDFIKRKC